MIDDDRVLDALAAKVPFSDPRRRRLAGHAAWVNEADDLLASTVAVVAGRRTVVLYGGTLDEEAAVLAALRLPGT